MLSNTHRYTISSTPSIGTSDQKELLMLPPLPHLGGSWRIFEDFSTGARNFLESEL
jgi:hypothetical protein